MNVEGIGFGGAMDLLDTEFPFGSLHTLESVVDPVARKVTLTVDGKAADSRELNAKPIAIDELTLAGRYYTHGAGQQIVRGTLKGDIAEVLLYNRVLSS